MFRSMMTTSTNYLRDDLQSTLSNYTSEKEHLVRQLNSLESIERTASSVSMASTNDHVFSSGLQSPKKSSYFRAPNIAASTSSGSVISNSSWRDSQVASTDKKWKEKRDADKIKKEKEMLKLPVIHSARHKRSEWDSGQFSSDTNLADSMSTYEPLPGINAAKGFLLDSMKIPNIHDPQRTDTAFDTHKSKTGRKKVTFADDNGEDFLSTVKTLSPVRKKDNKSGSKKGVPKVTITSNQFSYAAKPVRPRKTSVLPPLDISQNEAQKNPHKVTEGVNQWKSLYCNILDPEARMRALTDILHAVRLKKIENEMTIRYGAVASQQIDRDQMVNQYLQATASEKIMYSDANGQKRRGYMPSPRRAALQLGHRSSAYQLQNYLRQMQKSRRITEPLTDQSYGLAVSDTSTPIQETIRSNPSPVSVKA